MKLVCSAQLALIETHLAGVLDRLFTAEGLTRLNGIIRDYVLSPGKRIRPQLCLWTYSQIADTPAAPAVLDLACGWELFHAFLLAHDDIIDNAHRRRNRPSLHLSLASLDSDGKQFGANLGIVAGDLMFGAAMRLWHELDLPSGVYRRELQLFSRIACTTGFGQAIDIVQSHVPLDAVCEDVLLREYHWKTAAYTFEGPMLAATIVAGLDGEAQNAISRFALSIGQAYQLQNDLQDLSTAAHTGCDLIEGKRTIPLMRARGLMNEPQRVDFDRRFAHLAVANGQAVALAEELRRELNESGALDETRNLIAMFLNDARDAAEDEALSCRFREGLNGLLTSLERSYFLDKRPHHAGA